MDKKIKIRYGSITIMALFIFLIIISVIVVTLEFAVLQNSLSKNQLEKIQNRYRVEDSLYELIYDKENIEKYISDSVFRTYRVMIKTDDEIFNIKFGKDDILKDKIKKAYYKIKDINRRKNIIFYLDCKYDNIESNIAASGTLIREIFELEKTFLIEDELSDNEKALFIDFLEQIEDENCDYDCKLNSNSKKFNSSKDMTLKLKKKIQTLNKIHCIKEFETESGKSNKNDIEFSYHSMIVSIKRDKEENRSLTIGDLENLDLIKMGGVLYIEGDLIINQDFEFLGLIIINDGDIIVNSTNKPKVEGMIFYRGDNIDKDSIDIIYNQEIIYKQASFLPGFIEIEIDTIKKY